MKTIRLGWILIPALLAGCRWSGNGPDGSGTIECTQVTVAPLVAGRIAEFPLQEGDAVKAGDLVATLEATDYELRRDEAAAVRAAAKADLDRIRAAFQKKSVTGKQMDDAQAAHDLAQARFALAEKAVADGTVRAPTGGVVTVRAREPGEYVAPGAPLVAISRLDEVWLSVYIPADRLGRVKLGQPAQVKVDGDPKRYEGRVTFIASEAEFTPKNVQTPEERVKLVYRVKITLPNPDGVFKPGMPADGYLEPR
ncbi:MAG: Cobalt-zinc-cadmium resistance protein CzcB [Verrucomicrobia bacterium ADurb.Bin345]|nr:MAG: Cobalt-zinc-cadmium resistance protein CzcB [Verrucomicrobia bacterium ADurb.Bin345]